MYKTFYIFLLFTTGFLFAEYKNTNGVASDKAFGDMLQWIRSDIEPEITKIELSSDWQKLNLSEDDNYAIWIGHSTFLIKWERKLPIPSEVVRLPLPMFTTFTLLRIACIKLKDWDIRLLEFLWRPIIPTMMKFISFP